MALKNAANALGLVPTNTCDFPKGLGLPAHMPRAKPGIGFGYLHGPNPADHMKAEHDWIASSPDDLKAFHIDGTSDPFALDRAKVEVYRATQIYYAAMDSAEPVHVHFRARQYLLL
jgi:hypothetical protein